MNSIIASIPALEVAQYFQRVIQREVPVIAEGHKPYNGDLVFRLGDWQVEFTYFDGSLDRCEFVRTPDGRETSSDEWVINDDDNGNPLYLLSIELILSLENILNEAINHFSTHPIR